MIAMCGSRHSTCRQHRVEVVIKVCCFAVKCCHSKSQTTIIISFQLQTPHSTIFSDLQHADHTPDGGPPGSRADWQHSRLCH